MCYVVYIFEIEKIVFYYKVEILMIIRIYFFFYKYEEFDEFSVDLNLWFRFYIVLGILVVYRLLNMY